MELCCQQDARRDSIRGKTGWNGLDYLELSLDAALGTGATLSVYFLGKMPPEFTNKDLDALAFLQLTGGRQINDIRIVAAVAFVDPDPEIDDVLQVTLDKAGDFSVYTLSLVNVANIDPHYSRLDFSFKIDCPSDLDCAPVCSCEPAVYTEPDINYLAKDYASFRQLLLDRLSVVMPDWSERHVPDIGIALVELMAYTGDHLSYYQDAVATEAYLETARLRVSVRRHVRLVDYILHEGCNARAWLCLTVSSDIKPQALSALSFVTGLNNSQFANTTVLDRTDLVQIPASAYDYFEPLPWRANKNIELLAARNEIYFYTWGDSHCCLPKGSVSATLLDKLIKDEPKQYALDSLQVGDVLIFKEVLGPKSGLPVDADPLHRHAVRITGISRGSDAVILTETGQPTPYVEIQWAQADALPFSFCLSAQGPAPDCKLITHISVVCANVLLVDLGQTIDFECLGEVPSISTTAGCECIGHPGEINYLPGPFRPRLAKTGLTYSAPLLTDTPKLASAQDLLSQNVRSALPNLRVYSLSTDLRQLLDAVDLCARGCTLIDDDSGSWLQCPIELLPKVITDRYPTGKLPLTVWSVQYDLLESSADDAHVVVEMDNDGIAQLRFGDGTLGRQPEAGSAFFARYRIGNGVIGNVGAESINHLVLTDTKLSGVTISVANPLAAVGGVDPELIAEAKLFAPHNFRKQLERAITAADYQTLAERNPQLQKASAELVWTGSWYEADVAVDPFGTETADPALLADLEGYLYRYRRIGHDLRVLAADYVPILLTLEVCVLPHFQRGHVQAALLAAFSNRRIAGGQLGFFHPDNLSFGVDIDISKLIAKGMTIPGVECLRVTQLQRQFGLDNGELASGLLRLGIHEIAQLDNDPVYPERGKLTLNLSGGR